MKLLYDLFYAQPLNNSKYHGGGEYMKTLLSLLLENRGQNIIEVFLNPDAFIDEWVKKLLVEYNVTIHEVHNKKEIETIINGEYDVFYTGMPYQYLNVQLPKKTRTIATVHGLRRAEKPIDKYTYLYYTGAAQLKAIIQSKFCCFLTRRAICSYRQCISMFDEIITGSIFSKYSIKSLINPNMNVEVFYAPNKYVSHGSLKKDTLERIIQQGKYILLLGGNRWEKNIYRAIKAIEQIFEMGELIDYKVVICGKIPDGISRRIKYYQKFVFYEFVDGEELDCLYKYCDIFVYPTLNEGFGLPPLEAMKYGKTCVISAVCSLPEIYQNAVFYFNPYDINEITNKILTAAYERKESHIVINQYEKITKKQHNDALLLCNYILREKN